MKKIIKTIAAIIISLAITVFSTVPTYCNNQYYRTGVVTNVDYDVNKWLVLDTTGNVWSFSDGEDLIELDIVQMVMDDNNTPDITDDIITHVYYLGYYEI